MDTSQFKVELHPGGMIEKRAIEPEFRQHIINSDARIATETGATFGEAYLQRVKSKMRLFLILIYQHKRS